MKKKYQPRFKQRGAAVKAIEEVKMVMPNGSLSHVPYHDLSEWHGALEGALSSLEPLGVPGEVSYAKKMRLKIKEEMASRSPLLQSVG